MRGLAAVPDRLEKPASTFRRLQGPRATQARSQCIHYKPVFELREHPFRAGHALKGGCVRCIWRPVGERSKAARIHSVC